MNEWTNEWMNALILLGTILTFPFAITLFQNQSQLSKATWNNVTSQTVFIKVSAFCLVTTWNPSLIHIDDKKDLKGGSLNEALLLIQCGLQWPLQLELHTDSLYAPLFSLARVTCQRVILLGWNFPCWVLAKGEFWGKVWIKSLQPFFSLMRIKKILFFFLLLIKDIFRTQETPNQLNSENWKLMSNSI